MYLYLDGRITVTSSQSYRPRSNFLLMDVSLLSSASSFQIKYQRKIFVVILVFSIFTANKFAFSENSCILDIQSSSFGDNSTCAGGDWDGFLNNNCCKSTFDGYLHALGKQANQTGKIFLNSFDQKGCLTSMEGIDASVFKCGLEKLTSGEGGCSDYTISDVANNLGYELKMLGKNCEVLGSAVESSTTCSACFDGLRGINGSANNSMAETDLCKFAVLITLTSQRINDEKWVQAFYQCLGQRSLFLDDKGSTNEKHKKFKTGLWILVGGTVGIVLIIIVGSVWILSQKFKKAKLEVGKDVVKDSESEDFSCHRISIKDIYSATNNLNALNFIGQGIAGKVYKGILPNGQHIAVKHTINDGQMETFVREVTSLSHVRHPNLVAILGHCMGDEECFLIYELCQRGNLSEWLFGKDKALSWTQRLEIAVDCARGLWFLHTYSEGCIVHRDIKPTNILLCANYQAKLSDFGLSKVIAVDKSYVSSEVRGTFGYVDPEYRNNHRVNSSGDVYSFGIVILQLISGRRVINLDANKPMPLNKMARMLTRGGNVIDFADCKLNGKFPEEAFELVLELALTCTGIKQQRPSMEQVVRKLEKALDISTRDKFVISHFSQ